jgi:hypothetical protein
MAREFYRLVELESKRTLNAKETRLLEALAPVIDRIELKESKRRKGAKPHEPTTDTPGLLDA